MKITTPFGFLVLFIFITLILKAYDFAFFGFIFLALILGILWVNNK